MTPIEKNVRVVDELGNEYEATYPKRAKGLVKNGRARFVDEHTICLACPPDKILEDSNMSDINEIKVDETTGEVREDMTAASQKYTLDYALEQLEKVRNDEARFAEETREKICSIKSGDPEDVGAQAAAEALSELVSEHGKLYRRLTDFYIEMIDGLKQTRIGASPDIRKQFLNFVSDIICNQEPGFPLPDFEKIWQIMNT